MPRDRLISFYSKEQTPDFVGSVEYKNPKLFTGRVPSYATHFCTDDEKIAAVYESKGVERHEANTKHKENPVPKEEVSYDIQEEKEGQRQEAEVGWRDLPWPQMRAKAAQLSDIPITSKAIAIQVLEEKLG